MTVFQTEFMSVPNQQYLTPPDPSNHIDVDTYQLTAPEALDFLVSGWLDDSFPELGAHSFNLDDMNSTWDIWEPL